MVPFGNVKRKVHAPNNDTRMTDMTSEDKNYFMPKAERHRRFEDIVVI